MSGEGLAQQRRLGADGLYLRTRATELRPIRRERIGGGAGVAVQDRLSGLREAAIETFDLGFEPGRAAGRRQGQRLQGEAHGVERSAGAAADGDGAEAPDLRGRC